MIDLHCHIDLYPEPASILREVDARGTYVLAVTTTPKAWRGTGKLVGARKRVRVALGLHPELVALRYSEVALLCELLPEARFVGEIGLDGSPAHRSSLGLQQEVFERILEASASLGGRIMSIHSRGAATLVLDALERHRGAGVPILHWFTGTVSELERAIAMGCWFSIGPAMFQSKKGRDLALRMPLKRVLTETDGPFARNGQNAIMPWQAYDCLVELASLSGGEPDELRQQVQENFRSLSTAR
ncbi:Qat anti-phage system TatD family nuclease QatD [Rhodovulum sulfidophilum]|uniref:Qat anti-phage system TatD family nuclease QatD n=1 Tax=Rhodovulum sulfidophilum TaxID=35806 RepID=UPI0009522245|nr:TatD family hydrolase [Rhodovulum sulfidophilum]OLS50192.1 hydrolase TatD [Rhodovulum sulfidophilum]